jgi:hypothetical protein
MAYWLGSIPASSTETVSKAKQKPVKPTFTGFFVFAKKQSKAEKSRVPGLNEHADKNTSPRRAFLPPFAEPVDQWLPESLDHLYHSRHLASNFKSI